MAYKATLQFKATVEKIPAGDADNPEFVAWCEKHNAMIYGGSRRAWLGKANTCLRDAEYLVKIEEAEGYPHPYLLLTEAEYQNAFVKA